MPLKHLPVAGSKASIEDRKRIALENPRVPKKSVTPKQRMVEKVQNKFIKL